MITLDTAFFKEELFRVFEINGLSSLIDDERAEKLALLTEIMLEENQKYNLTAIKETDKIILLHYADSLMTASLFGENSSVIDVGCGAGFPSVPLAICRPDLKITAMDSTAKKVNYVDMVSNELSLNITAVCARAEDAAKGELRERFDIVFSRAVARTVSLTELCLPLVSVGGYMLALKSIAAKEELEEAKAAIDILGGDTPILFGSDERNMVIIKKIKKTPKGYPRKAGKATKEPIK